MHHSLLEARCPALQDLPVTRSAVHTPPSPPVVAELMQAGLTFATAMAMESWKAHEVLELLRHARARDTLPGPPPAARASI